MRPEGGFACASSCCLFCCLCCFVRASFLWPSLSPFTVMCVGMFLCCCICMYSCMQCLTACWHTCHSASLSALLWVPYVVFVLLKRCMLTLCMYCIFVGVCFTCVCWQRHLCMCATGLCCDCPGWPGSFRPGQMPQLLVRNSYLSIGNNKNDSVM